MESFWTSASATPSALRFLLASAACDDAAPADIQAQDGLYEIRADFRKTETTRSRACLYTRARMINLSGGDDRRGRGSREILTVRDWTSPSPVRRYHSSQTYALPAWKCDRYQQTNAPRQAFRQIWLCSFSLSLPSGQLSLHRVQRAVDRVSNGNQRVQRDQGSRA